MGGGGSKKDLPTYYEKDIHLEAERGVGEKGNLARICSGPHKGTLVAVRRIDSKDLPYLDAKARRRIAHLRHECIARCVGILHGSSDKGTENQSLMWEYCEGGSVFDLLESHRCSKEDRLKIAVNTCRGLLHMHESGYVHARLHPRNILLQRKDSSEQRVVKLSDYEPRKELVRDSTRTGTIAKKPATTKSLLSNYSPYEAPEVSAGSLATDRSDVYSLGMCLQYIWYREIEGKSVAASVPPLTGEGTEHTRSQGTTTSHKEGSSYGFVDLVIRRALHKDPDHRPTVEKILEVLTKRCLSRLNSMSNNSCVGGSLHEGDPGGGMSSAENSNRYFDALSVLAQVPEEPSGKIPDQLPSWYIRQQAEMDDGLGISASGVANNEGEGDPSEGIPP